MGLFDIFKKKYDLEKDNLTIEFNIYTMKYEVKQGDKIIPIEYLNNTTKKIFQEKQNEYEKRIDDRLNVLKSYGFKCDSFQSFSKKEGTMTKEVEDVIMPLIEEKNVLLGIYRIEQASEDSIKKMLNNGIQMSNHGSTKSIDGPSLESKFSIYPDNKTILKEIMFAHEYKESKGSIIIRIPDEDLKDNIYIPYKGLKENVYLQDEYGNYYINPKYIVGYFEVDENNNVLSVRKSEQKVEKNNTLLVRRPTKQTEEEQTFRRRIRLDFNDEDIYRDKYDNVNDVERIDFINNFHKVDEIIITEEIYLKNIEN